MHTNQYKQSQLDNEAQGEWDGQKPSFNPHKDKWRPLPSPLLYPLIRTHPRTDGEPHFSATSANFSLSSAEKYQFLSPLSEPNVKSDTRETIDPPFKFFIKKLACVALSQLIPIKIMNNN